MSGRIGYREVLALTLEQLGTHPEGQYATLTDAVITSATGKGLLPTAHQAGGIRYVNSGRSGDEERISELVREAMWDCLTKRLIVFGMNGSNSNWPFYRVTEYGASAVKSTTPQPYDPDGFMVHFDATCADIEPAVRAYVAEAVLAFNGGCMRSAAVMLGCASEKLLLLLCDAFEGAVSDPAKKAKFTKDLNTKWAISHKYATVRDRLDLMVTAKKLPHEHAETVLGELPAGFELLRRCRNAAGHPDVPGSVDPDTVFMNLRMFTEYARRAHSLIGHFGTAAADW